jgi:hypothetical protein
MSFATYLNLSGKKYPVEAVTYGFSRGAVQNADNKPEPSTSVFCNGISVTLKLDDDDKILDWMSNSHKKLDGSIQYMKEDEDSTLKEFKFKQAYCVSYMEGFSANDTTTATVATITIMPQGIEMGDISWDPTEE